MLSREMFFHKFYMLDGGGGGGGGAGSDPDAVSAFGEAGFGMGIDPTTGEIGYGAMDTAGNIGPLGMDTGMNTGLETSTPSGVSQGQMADIQSGFTEAAFTAAMANLGPSPVSEQKYLAPAPTGKSIEAAAAPAPTEEGKGGKGEERRLTREQKRRRRSILGEDEQWAIHAPGRQKALLGE